MSTSTTSPVPEVGQAVRVRGRLATVQAVDPYDTRTGMGRWRIVDVEYLDDYRFPETEQLLWEVEATGKVLGLTSLPRVDQNRPDRPDALRAFVNANRWSRLNRDPDKLADEPLMGVWNSAIQVHPYQLEPVLRALTMPRVSLLLADGVGLGKTVQSGLVLEELLLRRRIRRILVICPSMLQRQWKIELRRKFNLDFEIIDSETTFQFRRRLGIDTNPWKVSPRIITSMDYLRMPDVLHQFQQASETGTPASENGSRAPAHAPWDLLIVDECHHFAPQSGGRASQRTKMLREIRFLFEHRIFASATPHNGKTVSFTGLLELLDPVRFQMTVEMDDQDKRSLSEVRVRRLKEEINKQSLEPVFADQMPPVELPVQLSSDEIALYSALREYRRHGQAALHQGSPQERWVGQFIYSLLTKRLLSCPYAFARTWWRHLDSDADANQSTLFEMAKVSAERAEDQVRSDEERSTLEADAARYSGVWLRNRKPGIDDLQQRVSTSLARLGYDRRKVEDEQKLALLAEVPDSKTEALVRWIKTNLFTNDGKLRDDERLIVFTEYRETLHFIEQGLLKEGFDKNTLRLLYGGMDAGDFEAVKAEFEDPTASVRLLLATDAASEGINMQESCRWIIHFDIPWSPSKLQQRNGRVSRHGQVRPVYIHYFRCDEEEDLNFLFQIAQKVEQVRNDLGSVERVFDAAIQRHFQDFQGKSIPLKQIDLFVKQTLERSPVKNELGSETPEDLARLTKRAKELLESTDTRLGISPNALVDILRTAVQVEGQGAVEEVAHKPGFYRLQPPARWEGLARQTLTVGSGTDRVQLVFDSTLVEDASHGPRVLRLKRYEVLMRLGHPIMRQAMATLTRQLHDPIGHSPIFRWSVAALHRPGFEALMAFHYTVTATNELREPLHDEVLTTVFCIEGDSLVPVEPSFEQSVIGDKFLPIHNEHRRDNLVRNIRTRWLAHRQQLEAFLKAQETAQRKSLADRAKLNLERDLSAASESYRYRLKELQDRGRDQDLKKLAQELAREQAEVDQPALFEDVVEESKTRLQQIEEQMAVLRQSVDQTRLRLEQERDQRLNIVLPKRFQLREVRVLPLALTYLVPANAEDVR